MNVLGKERVHWPDFHEALKDFFLEVRLNGKIIMSRLDIRWQAEITAGHGGEVRPGNGGLSQKS